MNYFSSECPLIIGVTGHRDLLTENFTMINPKLDEIFNDIEQKFKDLPKVVFSPLAEGADRLVAKKALERGYKLFVPIPMPLKDYENDFAEESAKNEFRALIGNAEKVFEIPVSYELEKENDLSVQSNKNLRYAVVGRFMASNCDILISLTDGIKQNIPGGASYVTTLMIEGISFIETSDKWIAPEYGLVYHLITPRKKNEGKTSGTPFSWTIIPSRSVLDETEAGKDKVISGIKLIHRHLHNYSRDCYKNCNKLTVSSPLRNGNLASDKFSFQLKSIAEFFMMADSASRLMQKRTMRYFNWIFVLGLLASVFSVLHSEIKKMPWWEVLWLRDFELLFLFLFLLTILGGVLFWQICKKAEYQNKYQDFRATAEAFRVQFFWEIAGINESAAEHYLEEKRSVLDWIRLAVRYSIMDTLPDIRKTNTANCKDKFSFDEKVKLLREDWICDQKRYFEQNALRMTQKLTFNEKIAKILFVSGICFALIGLGTMFLHGFISFNNEYFEAIVVFLSIILPVVAGLVKYRIDKLGWIELIQHYKVMAGRFSRAEHFLDKIISANSYPEAQQKNIKILVHNLGVASLLENSEWLFFRRLKDIELPAK